MGSEDEWLSSIRSDRTRKNYARGFRLFKQFLQKDADEILNERIQQLKEDDPRIKYLMEKTFDRFLVWLTTEYRPRKKPMSKNSSKAVAIGARAFFSFHRVGLKLRGDYSVKGGANRRHILDKETLRKIFAVTDLRGGALISLAKDIGLRITDFLSITKDLIESAIEDKDHKFEIMTSKENIKATCFLSDETIRVLKVYLPTIETERLFDVTPDAANDILEKYAKVAKIPFKPTFHDFRRTFISTGSNLGISQYHLKALTGKAIGSDMQGYLLDQDLKKSATKIQDALKITETRSNNGRVVTLEKAVELVMEVQKQELLEKVKKLWNEKWGKYISTGSGETLGLMIRRPDFENMSAKELLRQYLELTKEKQ